MSPPSLVFHIRLTKQQKSYILLRFDEEIHQDEGDYKLCFSNYMSTWSEKHVWFEVKIARDLKG